MTEETEPTPEEVEHEIASLEEAEDDTPDEEKTEEVPVEEPVVEE